MTNSLNRLLNFFRGTHISPDYRPITPFSVAPAEVPDAKIAEELAVGRARLDHHVASAERTVATLFHDFAEKAASNARRQ